MPASLARRYAVEAEVLRRDDSPAGFTWRGRRYTVCTVLDHWWETAAWWVGRGADGTLSGSVADDEREVWRVEARVAGATAPATGAPAVMELCFAWSTGTWTVSAVMD
jgi:hypothetical protein